MDYLSAKDVNKLVSLSKQYWISDYAWFQLEHKHDIPAELLTKLKILHSSDGTMRFFAEDFWMEVQKCIGLVSMNQYRDILKKCATEDFLKQRTPQWTQERAQAHLQDADIVAKRASVHHDLWLAYNRYKDAGRPMTEMQLRRWIDIARIDATLRPGTWFRDKLPLADKGDMKVVQRLWEEHLAVAGVDVMKSKKSLYDLHQKAKEDLS